MKHSDTKGGKVVLPSPVPHRLSRVPSLPRSTFPKPLPIWGGTTPPRNEKRRLSNQSIIEEGAVVADAERPVARVRVCIIDREELLQCYCPKCVMSSQNGCVVVCVNVLACGQPKCKQCWTTVQSDFIVHDWLMMSPINGGFERQKVRLVLDDEQAWDL